MWRATARAAAATRSSSTGGRRRLRRRPPPTIGGIQEDTGTPGDGITSDASPILVGTAAPGSTVTVSYTDAAGAQTATGTVGSDGSWQIVLPTLPDGSYSFVA